MKSNLYIIKGTKEDGAFYSLPFNEMKNKILGSKYELSLHFVTSEEIKKLNNQYRKIDQPTDILSFPIDESEGEIFICIEEAKKEAIKFAREEKNFVEFLFIHGLVHLKGLDHGEEMDRQENEYRKYFGI